VVEPETPSSFGMPLEPEAPASPDDWLIVADQNVVVTQPSEGEFRCFSAVCTHQGCLVSDVEDGTINCNCHFSRFSIEDGSVVAAAEGGDPAQQDPLPELEIEVDGDEIRLA
jgi:Rieske Fe-S protein